MDARVFLVGNLHEAREGAPTYATAPHQHGVQPPWPQALLRRNPPIASVIGRLVHDARLEWQVNAKSVDASQVPTPMMAGPPSEAQANDPWQPPTPDPCLVSKSAPPKMAAPFKPPPPPVPKRPPPRLVGTSTPATPAPPHTPSPIPTNPVSQQATPRGKRPPEGVGTRVP